MMHVKNKWKEVKPARVNETEIKIISALLLHATIWSFVPFFYPLPTSLGSSVLLAKSILEWHVENFHLEAVTKTKARRMVRSARIIILFVPCLKSHSYCDDGAVAFDC